MGAQVTFPSALPRPLLRPLSPCPTGKEGPQSQDNPGTLESYAPGSGLILGGEGATLSLPFIAFQGHQVSLANRVKKTLQEDEQDTKGPGTQQELNKC
jgi:hypothetical protein